MIDRGQTRDVADQFIQQRWLNQVCLFGDEGLLSQDNLLGCSGVGGQQAPVDVATVTQVWVVTVLLGADSEVVSSANIEVHLYLQKGWWC